MSYESFEHVMKLSLCIVMYMLFQDSVSSRPSISPNSSACKRTSMKQKDCEEQKAMSMSCGLWFQTELSFKS